MDKYLNIMISILKLLMLRVTLQNLLQSPSTFPQTRIKPADPDTIFTVMVELQRTSQETNQSETFIITWSTRSVTACWGRRQIGHQNCPDMIPIWLYDHFRLLIIPYYLRSTIVLYRCWHKMGLSWATSRFHSLLGGMHVLRRSKRAIANSNGKHGPRRVAELDLYSWYIFAEIYEKHALKSSYEYFYNINFLTIKTWI